jgi:triosephosphate isomerase
MSERRPLIAGNWKMNTTLEEAIALAGDIAASDVENVDLVICPPFPWLVPVRGVLEGSAIGLGAQNCSDKANGAYTGEVSTAMLAEICDYVIVGHSERRQWFGENDELVRKKTAAAVNASLAPILCVGESLETRQAGRAETFVIDQLAAALDDRHADEVRAVTVAYEPIWAIGTGMAASASDAEAMSRVIRQAIDQIQPGVADSIRILYGGSVTPANCVEILSQPNVDGALVGGASLKAASFLEIARSANR